MLRQQSGAEVDELRRALFEHAHDCLAVGDVERDDSRFAVVDAFEQQLGRVVESVVEPAGELGQEPIGDGDASEELPLELHGLVSCGRLTHVDHCQRIRVRAA